MGYSVVLIGERIDRDRVGPTGARGIPLRRWPLPKRYRLKMFSRRADRLARGCDFVAGHGHNLLQHVLSLHNCLHLAHELTFGKPLHGDPPAEFQQAMMRRQDFRFCIANSELMRDDIIRRYGVPAGKIEVIYPGYNPLRFNTADRDAHRRAVRAELGVDDDAVLAGLITSGNFRKRGLDLAIDAFASLPAETRRRARLLVIGKDARTDEFRRQAGDRGLSEQVRFLSPTPQVERFYHGLDIYLHPARFAEFGQSVQEAMACGLPVIAGARVGATELLPPQARAELPAIMDLPTLLERLRVFINDAELRHRWSGYGLEAAAKNSDAINFEKTHALYRRAGL
jgi:UDP-glucose:(heptosyl)LPS alpha-1,3-glucosyltransferase